MGTFEVFAFHSFTRISKLVSYKNTSVSVGSFVLTYNNVTWLVKDVRLSFNKKRQENSVKINDRSIKSGYCLGVIST